MVSFLWYTSKVDPNNIKEALKYEHLISTIHDELLQFRKNDFWELIHRPSEKNVIGTKWIYNNKKDKNGTIIQNKARLVA